MNDQEKEFMIGLTNLTRKTGVIITGCGCCGSPRLMTEENSPSIEGGYGFGGADQVCWISPEDEYDWENYSHSIVRELK